MNETTETQTFRQDTTFSNVIDTLTRVIETQSDQEVCKGIEIKYISENGEKNYPNSHYDTIEHIIEVGGIQFGVSIWKDSDSFENLLAQLNGSEDFYSVKRVCDNIRMGLPVQDNLFAERQ